MITRLRIHNFKTFLNFEMALTRRHLLIGKNNSGKTNLCHALRFLGATTIAEYAKIPMPGGLAGFGHWDFRSPVSEFSCTCELPFGGESLVFKYDLHIHVEPQVGLPVSDREPARTVLERLSVRGHEWSDVPLIDSDGETVRLLDEERYSQQDGTGSSYEQTPAPSASSVLFKLYELNTNKRAMHFKRFLTSFAYHALSPPLMRHGWAIEQLGTTKGGHFLDIEGQNLPMVLFLLKNEDEPRYREIVRRVSQIEPMLDSLNFFVTPDNKPVPYVILRGNKKVSWDVLSNGTLSILGLAAIFLQAERLGELPNCPSLLNVIEEPENSLYRGQFQALWDDFDRSPPGGQWLFTSHSPYFIDLFDRDLECITRLKKEGQVTTARPLSQFRETIERYRNEYDFSLGEQFYKEVFE